jgi:hypothetical protein
MKRVRDKSADSYRHEQRLVTLKMAIGGTFSPCCLAGPALCRAGRICRLRKPRFRTAV